MLKNTPEEKDYADKLMADAIKKSREEFEQASSKEQRAMILQTEIVNLRIEEQTYRDKINGMPDELFRDKKYLNNDEYIGAFNKIVEIRKTIEKKAKELKRLPVKAPWNLEKKSKSSPRNSMGKS